MKLRNLFLLSILAAVPAQACGSGPTHVEWPGWRVLSTEKRWGGVKYNSYPLYHLVDGNSKTAWVYSGVNKCWNNADAGIWGGRHSVIFAAEKPFWVDEVRLLTGFNKSANLFARNNRVRTIQILKNGDEGSTWARTAKSIKGSQLMDKPGWHSIALPKQQVSSLVLNLRDFYQGKDNDVCLSEVQFRCRGRMISWRLPQAVIANQGFQDSGCNVAGAQKPDPRRDGLIDTRTGRKLMDVKSESGPLWSPGSRKVADLQFNSRGDVTGVAVADVKQAKLLKRRNLQTPAGYEAYPDLAWLDDTRLQITYRPISSVLTKTAQGMQPKRIILRLS